MYFYCFFFFFKLFSLNPSVKFVFIRVYFQQCFLYSIMLKKFMIQLHYLTHVYCYVIPYSVYKFYGRPYYDDRQQNCIYYQEHLRYLSECTRVNEIWLGFYMEGKTLLSAMVVSRGFHNVVWNNEKFEIATFDIIRIYCTKHGRINRLVSNIVLCT